MPAKIENLRSDDYDLNIKESFIIEDFHVNERFINYQENIVTVNNIGGLLVEFNTHELLAVNNALLLKAE